MEYLCFRDIRVTNDGSNGILSEKIVWCLPQLEVGLRNGTWVIERKGKVMNVRLRSLTVKKQPVVTEKKSSRQGFLLRRFWGGFGFSPICAGSFRRKTDRRTTCLLLALLPNAADIRPQAAMSLTSSSGSLSYLASGTWKDRFCRPWAVPK